MNTRPEECPRCGYDWLYYGSCPHCGNSDWPDDEEQPDPCPFCGSLDIETDYTGEPLSLRHRRQSGHALCNGCGATGPVVTVVDGDATDLSEAAIEAWDNRGNSNSTIDI